jgi:hypothetical protein
LVTDRSSDALVKTGTLYFPKTSTRETTTYTEGQLLTDILTANTDTNVTLTINQAPIIASIIPWTLEAKSMYDQKALRLREATYAVAKTIDSYIASLAASFTYNITSSSVTIANLLKAFEYLNLKNVPLEDRAWVFAPPVLSDLVALTSGFFIQTLSSDEKSLMTGKIGMILGSPVYISNNLTASTSGSPATSVYANMYFHKTAIAYAALVTPKIEITDNDQLVQGTMISVKSLFGACILDADRGVQIVR